jgi:hypothetical protein
MCPSDLGIRLGGIFSAKCCPTSRDPQNKSALNVAEAEQMASFSRQTKETLSLRDAAAWVASATGSPEPHISTVHRWVVRGVRGVRLSATRVGARFLTTANDLADFLDRLNSSPQQIQPVASFEAAHGFQQRVRMAQVDAACERLERLCAGFSAEAPESASKSFGQPLQAANDKSNATYKRDAPKEAVIANPAARRRGNHDAATAEVDAQRCSFRDAR